MDKDNTVGMLVLELSTFNHVRARFNNLLHGGIDGLVYSMQAWSFRESDETRRDLGRCVFFTEVA